MSLRFRKIFNIGGFRINLSKSGIGYSYGIKGFRKTKKASGGHRTTVSIPGTGTSYVHDSKKKTSKRNTKTTSFCTSQKEEKQYSLIESSINEVQSSLAKSIQTRFRIKKFFYIPLIIFIATLLVPSIVGGIFWLLLIISSICLLISFILSKKIKLYYTSSDFTFFLDNFKKVIDSALILKNSSSSFQIYETKNQMNAQSAAKESVCFRQKSKYIKSNVEFFEFYSKSSSILFLPDIYIVFTQNQYHTFSYRDLSVNYVDLEHLLEKVPADSFVINQKYLHETKNHTADLRYKNNPLLFNCAFGGFTLQNKSGLDMGFVFSNRESAKSFCSSLSDYINFFSSIEN